MPAWTMTTCARCGAAIDQAATGRPRRFCSDACKQRAYRRARDDERGRRITETARRWLATAEFHCDREPEDDDHLFDVTIVTRTAQGNLGQAVDALQGGKALRALPEALEGQR